MKIKDIIIELDIPPWDDKLEQKVKEYIRIKKIDTIIKNKKNFI